MKKILSGLVLATAALSIHAEDKMLPKMIVTATRTSQTINNLSAATTVFTREDIERLQAQGIPELLSRATGVDITQSGGPGKLTGTYVRGSSSSQVLVLIDGIRGGSVTSGTPAFASLPIEQIERIEIVRGSQSSLYGSEAIGGVIQIFTRKGQQKKDNTPSVSIDLGGGSYDTAKVSGNVSGKYNDGWYSLGASHSTTEGFSAQPLSNSTDNDRDSYENSSFNVRAGYQLNNSLALEAFALRSQGELEYDTSGFGGNDGNDFIMQNIGATAKLNITPEWSTTFSLGESRDELKYIDNTFTKNRRRTVRLINNFTLNSNHEIVIGSDFRDDNVESSTAYVKSSRYDIGGFAEYYGRWFDLINFNASVRGDEDEQFGSHVTGATGFRMELFKSGIDIIGSFSSGYKAPTLDDLYYPGYDNPDTKPEESTTFEIGLEGNHHWGRWMTRAYHTNIDQLITAPALDYKPVNVEKAQIDGVEMELSTQIYDWDLLLNGDILSPKNRKTNARLTDRAQLHLTADLSKEFFNSLTLGSSLAVTGDRLDGSTKLHGAIVWDLRSAYKLNHHWALKGKLNNLLNDQYQTNKGYNTANRNFFFSINYSH